MNKKLLTAAPPIQGGYLENSTKLQRGGKTSGLTCLDNCLSNSDIDFPLLSSQFKDLNLQLHASTKVTNPYTFSIQGNTSFGAQLESEIPDTSTVLGSNQNHETSESGSSVSVTVTIPNGVNVILVRGAGDIFVQHTGQQNDADLIIGRVNDSGTMVKTYSTGSGTSYSYVKVTPGKQYTIRLDGSDPDNGYSSHTQYNLYLYVYYSKAINNTTPTVTDL